MRKASGESIRETARLLGGIDLHRPSSLRATYQEPHPPYHEQMSLLRREARRMSRKRKPLLDRPQLHLRTLMVCSLTQDPKPTSQQAAVATVVTAMGVLEPWQQVPLLLPHLPARRPGETTVTTVAAVA